MACTFVHVGAVLGSNITQEVDFFTDSSTTLKKRRTLIYFHSLLFPSSVRAPITTEPDPGILNIALTDLPDSVLMFNKSCSERATDTTGFTTFSNPTFAGAFQNPRSLSTRVYTPAIAADGGSMIWYFEYSAYIALYINEAVLCK